MANVSIRDLIIYYTAKAAAYKYAASWVVKDSKLKKGFLELSEKEYDMAFRLVEARQSVGKTHLPDINLLERYDASK